MDDAQRKKAGDVLCDIGKYMVTVIPFSYFISDKPGTLYIIIGMTVFGLLFILYGLYLTKQIDNKKISGNKEKKTIRVMKNAVFVVEEERSH